jgi:hypothetical protein
MEKSVATLDTKNRVLCLLRRWKCPESECPCVSREKSYVCISI